MCWTVKRLVQHASPVKSARIQIIVKKREVTEFASIEVNLPEIQVDDLSTDQKYLYQIHQAVSRGDVPGDLAMRNPGNLNHSRWVTAANRILRLYVSTARPSEHLRLIVDFIMKVYVPMWFKIKHKPTVEDGPNHMLETIVLIRSVEQKSQDIARPVIQRNAFFLHPENILLSMIRDQSSTMRELGWRRILALRESATGELRKFAIPTINLDCSNLSDIIDWRKNISEPPLTMKLSIEEIKRNIPTKAIF